MTRHGQPGIITFTNVFAHIENQAEVLDSLRILLASDTILVIENHYPGAVLYKYQIDIFYHEHPRTYSRAAFDHIAGALGLNRHPVPIAQLDRAPGYESGGRGSESSPGVIHPTT